MTKSSFDVDTGSVVKKPRKRQSHHTLEQRRDQRARALKHYGKSASCPGEMLDLYLAGDSMAEIAHAYGLAVGSTYRSVAKEALFRLMEMNSVERLEEIEGIERSNR